MSSLFNTIKKGAQRLQKYLVLICFENINIALQKASCDGNLEEVKYLCENGAAIRIYNDSAMRWASLFGHIQVVKYLCENGADIKSDNNYSLRWASYNGDLELLKYICESGADIQSNYNYAIRHASANGHIQVVKYLCEAGADIRCLDHYAVRRASANGHYEVVKYLWEVGADISKITEAHRKYIAFCQKMEAKIRERAQKKIYFWWIPICYDVNRETGKRMMLKNLEKAKELGLEFNN